METATWLALDIGGANLKTADGRGFARSRAFAMWRDYRRLAAALRLAIEEAPSSDRLAVTMTGELADCFRSKAEGVHFILNAIAASADDRPVWVYALDGQLVRPSEAVDSPLRVASANWHALAQFSTRFTSEQSALLVDVGSTTVDVVPLDQGRVTSAGQTDRERLAAGELIYTGIERSPVCALVQTLPYHGHQCPVAQEVFATTRDVHLLLGHLPEDERDRETADRQPATCDAAHRRLARMLCADQQDVPYELACRWAGLIAQSQLDQLIRAAEQVLRRATRRPTTAVVTGHGQWLARQMLDRLGWSGRLVSLADQLQPAVSRAATAHALAVLAQEHRAMSR